MQAKDLTLDHPHELAIKDPRILGVLANSNVSTPLAAKTPSVFNCKQSELPPVNLENENQALKSQVEMLKSLLLGICKDQNISHPVLNVIDQSPSKISIEQLSVITHSSNQKQKSPKKGSPKKHQQQSKENNIDFLTSKTQHTQSNTDGSPSPKRRKRSDRIKSKSPSKEHNTAVRKVKQSIQEMPLQIQCKDQVITEDQQLEDDVLTSQSNVDFNEDSARFENVLDQNQTAELNENEDLQNSSQIHIKYAKMLEELENQSQDNNALNNNEFDLQAESINVLQHDLERTQQVFKVQSRSAHLRNKMSSQLEHKNFYELELEQLKQELEQCAKEEEKLLTMLVIPKEECSQPIDQYVQESPSKPFAEQNEYSPKIRLLCIPVIENIKETEEDISFSQLSAREIEIRTPAKHRLTQEEILNNLKDEVEYLLENEHQDNSGFLRPVKIDSPQNCYSQNKFNKQYLESSGGGRRSSLSSCKKDKITPQKEIVSSFDKRSPIHKKQSPVKSPTKRFSVQRADVIPAGSPPRSPTKKSQSSNKRNRNTMKNMFDLKRIGDYSEIKDDASNRSIQELDQLAKERALAQGLQQQEEPIEDEGFDSLDCLNNPMIISTTSKLKESKPEKNNYLGNFYGNYSREKSEELRNQRQESIKKAEELLNNNLVKEQPKRPDFISKYQRQVQEEVLIPEPNIDNDNIYVDCNEIEQEDEDENDYGQLEQQTPLIQLQEIQPGTNINDISFQDHEVAAINYVKFNQSSETSSKYQTLLNIEIPSMRQTPQCQTQTPQQITDSPVKQPQVTSKYQAYINKKIPNDHQKTHNTESQASKSSMQSSKKEQKSPCRHNYNQTQTLTQRRKSVGNEYSKKAQASTAYLMQNMSTKSRSDNQSVLGKSSTNPSCKPSPFRKDKHMNSGTKNQNIQQQEAQQKQFNSNFDAELLYQFRAKSVIKRREELLQKRDQENKQKVQAKCDKIDKLRQSRNSRLSPQRSNKDQYSAIKVQEYNDNVSQISGEEPRFYQSNIDCLSQTDIASHFGHTGNLQFQRSSLPSTQSNISCRLSNTSSIPTTSQLVSACTTYRKELEEPRISSRKQSASKTSSTQHLFKKNAKGYNQQLINRTMRVGQSKEKYQQSAFKSQINTNTQNTAIPSLSTTLHSSKSFIFKESASKQSNQALVENHKTKHNFRPSSNGLSSSRSAHKFDTKSQYSSTQRDSLGVPTGIKQVCDNCERLRCKGLSTDFCLNHFDSQQK